MPANNQPEEQPTADPFANSAYYFICICGCGQTSEKLDKASYIKLRKNQHWCAQGCQEGREIVKEFAGGYIIKDADF